MSVRHPRDITSRPHTTTSFDAATLAAGYSAGTLTPADVVEEALARIAARGADSVWIALAPREQLLEEARALVQRRAAGEALPALRPAVRGQGQHRRRRLADDGGLPGVRLHARGACAGGGAADRGRRDPDRQDQPGSVRDRAGRRALALRRSAQPVRRALHRRAAPAPAPAVGVARRRGQLRARHRHRRLGARAGGVQQHRRPQAEPRPAQHDGRRCRPAARSTACRSSRSPSRTRWPSPTSRAATIADDPARGPRPIAFRFQPGCGRRASASACRSGRRARFPRRCAGG